MANAAQSAQESSCRVSRIQRISFYLPNDEDYEVRIVGTETGTIDFTAVTGSGNAIASRTCNQVSQTEDKAFSYCISSGMNAAVTPLLVLDTSGKPAMNVQPDGSEIAYRTDMQGDINQDSQFTVTDVILLQKWLLAEPGICLPNWKAVDFDEDGQIDVFDLCLMKRELLRL